MPRHVANRIRDELEQIAQDPFAKRPNVRPIKGLRNAYRLRSGGWRGSYILHKKGRVMEVFEIAPRGRALYR